MPARLDRCVSKVMKEQGVPESKAFAICNAAMDSLLEDSKDIIVYDAIGLVKATIDPDSGFLTAPVTLARVGVQKYKGHELGMFDRAYENIGVLRTPEEVFSQKSIDSYTNLVVTNEHPGVPVDTSNVKNLQMGSVSGVEPDPKEGVLKGIVTITDQGLINKIKSGKCEVSVGYKHELVPEKSTYNGDGCEFKQTDINANHLAVVGKGRCGPACRISTDHNKKEDKQMVITIDGIEFETDNSQLVQAIKKQQETFDQKEELSEKELKMKKEEMDKLKTEKEKLKATTDAMASDKLSEEALAELVNDRATLIVEARSILGDDMPSCNCPKEIKAAIVSKILPDMSLDGKSEDYTNAAYDIAIKKAKDGKTSLDQVSKDFVTSSEDIKDVASKRQEARKKYAKDNLGMEVT